MSLMGITKGPVREGGCRLGVMYGGLLPNWART